MIEFFDSSALLKLYLVEDGSERVRAAARVRSRVVVSRIAYAETAATLGRLFHDGDIDEPKHDALLDLLDEDFPKFDVIEAKRWLGSTLRDLIGRRRLRGMDAIHLASALTLKPRPRFWSSDRDLADAAEAEGLRVIRPG